MNCGNETLVKLLLLPGINCFRDTRQVALLQVCNVAFVTAVVSSAIPVPQKRNVSSRSLYCGERSAAQHSLKLIQPGKYLCLPEFQLVYRDTFVPRR